MIELLKLHCPDNIGNGISKNRIRDLELRLNISLPSDFKLYLEKLNYAELFGDPIYGINDDNKMIDLYTQNKNKDHFKYGFLEFFTNDLDGTMFLRPDTGAVYNAAFMKPVSSSFSEFVKYIIAESS